MVDLNAAQVKAEQEERVKQLREQIMGSNPDFIRKELMLNCDVDVLNILNDQMFQKNYAFKEQE